MAIDTIPHRLFEQARSRPTSPAYYQKVDGRYRPTSFGEYAALVRKAAKALLALGFERGSTVSILGFNRPEWVVLDVAAMVLGGAPAGIYTTCSPEEVAYIIRHAESPLVLVEDLAQWKKVEKELGNLPNLKHVVTMLGAPKIDHPMVMGWADFLEKGASDVGAADAKVEERLASLEPQGLATLIYTSGTTGPPKGVMLSHENLAWTARVARQLTHIGPGDSMLSYLPLSHIAEQVFTIHGPISSGSSIYFAESIEKVPDNLKEVQPTLFFGVPRIWEKFHAAIAAKLAQAPTARRKLAEGAMRVASAYHEVKNRGQKPNPLLELAYKAASKVVFSKLKPAIGLGRARFCVSGAAPIAPAVLEFFMGLDVMIYEVYGQSEDTGPTSMNQPGRTKLGTVGPVIPGVDVKIAADDEILVKGPHVFLGYFKDPEATAEALSKDGWLHSGDLGRFDEGGFLHITGRKKEIIITAGGKNITPKNIESALKEHDMIAEAVVVGDRRKYLTALLVLDPDAVARFAKARGAAGSASAPEVRSEIQRAVDEVNGRFARVEGIKRFHVLAQPFSIESGELTPTMKVKRKVVYERYAREIDAMYEEG